MIIFVYNNKNKLTKLNEIYKYKKKARDTILGVTSLPSW